VTVQEFLTIVRYSEVNNLAVGDNDDALIAFLNLGMIELYTRFPIKVEEHIIELFENTTEYEMPDNFMAALSAYGEVPDDLPENVVQVAINEESDPYSIFFLDWNTVQVPAVANGSYISIIYIAKPETVANTAEGLASELELPASLIDTLASYIGYRAHLGVRGDGQSENNAHWQRFERNCVKAQELGVAFPADSMTMETRLSSRGFV
jgi:hypothetical protein